MKKLITFDLDNTFYNYEPTHQKALVSVFENQNFFKDKSLFNHEYEKSKNIVQNRLISSPSKHSKLLYFKEMFEGILTLSEISLLEEIYWNSFIQYADISKDVVNRLYESKQNADIYVLCTNQNTQIQLNKISSWGLDLFDFVITSEEVGYEKPNKLFFNYVEEKLQKIDVSSFKVYALGDDLENDIKYWKENYAASSFLIDNSIESFENINGVIHTNITKAVHDITN